jgi:hypothetical protein
MDAATRCTLPREVRVLVYVCPPRPVAKRARTGISRQSLAHAGPPGAAGAALDLDMD